MYAFDNFDRSKNGMTIQLWALYLPYGERGGRQWIFTVSFPALTIFLTILFGVGLVGSELLKHTLMYIVKASASYALLTINAGFDLLLSVLKGLLLLIPMELLAVFSFGRNVI